MTWIPKHARIRAEWKQPTNACLSGSMPKVGVVAVSLTGTVVHCRGDHPTAPTVQRLYVSPEGDVPLSVPRTIAYGCSCHTDTIEVRPEWVVEVLGG